MKEIRNKGTKKPTTEQQQKAKERRANLRALSKSVEKLVKLGYCSSINEGLKELYAGNGHETLYTLKEWNKRGYRVIKGQEALLLWGKPKKNQEEQDGEKPQTPADGQEEGKDSREFYPICYVFSNLQVEKRGEYGN